MSKELCSALERVRQLQVSPESISRVTDRILSITSVETAGAHARRQNLASWKWIGQLAASIGAVVVGWFALQAWLEHSPPIHDVGRIPDRVSYSAISRESLVNVVYKQVEIDLKKIEDSVEEVSQDISLSSVRREVMETIDEFRNWRIERDPRN